MPNVEKMSISLPTEIAGFVHSQVESGNYSSASEVVREAIRAMRERSELLGYSIEELRVLVQQGLESGPPVDGQQTFARIRARLEEHISSRRP